MLDQLAFTELWINQDNLSTMRLKTIKQRLRPLVSILV